MPLLGDFVIILASLFSFVVCPFSPKFSSHYLLPKWTELHLRVLFLTWHVDMILTCSFFMFFSCSTYSCEIPHLIWWARSSLNKIWDNNNNKRLLHNLNETHVYNFQNFFPKKLTGKYHFKLEHWECPLPFSPFSKMCS